MIVAFTGTQRGATREQLQTVMGLLKSFDRHGRRQFRHGAGHGADGEAHVVALLDDWQVDVYPSDRPSKTCINRLRPTCSTVHTPDHPMDSDKAMCVDADLVIGVVFSEYPERVGNGPFKGGTWQMIEHALLAGIKTAVVVPDGGLLYPPTGQRYEPR